MPAKVKRLKGGGIALSAWHEGEPPELPAGYRVLGAEEEVQVGDLTFNVIGQRWEPINEAVFVTVGLFSGPIKEMFRFPPIRKK